MALAIVFVWRGESVVLGGEFARGVRKFAVDLDWMHRFLQAHALAQMSVARIQTESEEVKRTNGWVEDFL